MKLRLRTERPKTNRPPRNPKPEKLTAGLEARGILGGLPIEQGILWCATEMNTKDEIDALEAAIREVC